MSRSELEQEVFDIEFGSMEYNGEQQELWDQIHKASTEDLEYYLKEYQEHLAFIAAVQSLQLPD